MGRSRVPARDDRPQLAEYVHQGFGQLTAATFLTVVVVAVTMRIAPREVARDALLLRVLLGLLCVLTLAVVASALYRMSLYQEAYGYTVLRVFVDGFGSGSGSSSPSSSPASCGCGGRGSRGPSSSRQRSSPSGSPP